MELHVSLLRKATSGWLRFVPLLLASDDAGPGTSDRAPAVGLTQGTVSDHLRQFRGSVVVEGNRILTNAVCRAVPLALSALVRVSDPESC